MRGRRSEARPLFLLSLFKERMDWNYSLLFNSDYKRESLPHEDGLADLADTLEDAGDEGKTEVETKAAEKDQVKIGPFRFCASLLCLSLLLLDFLCPLPEQSVGDSLDVVVL
jgi:hypothetical protein